MAGPGRSSEEGQPREMPNSVPRDLHPVADIRLVITDVAKLEERINGLIVAVEKLAPTFEKALDKQSVDLKERIAELKSDGEKTRDKLVDVQKDVSGFEGSVRVFAKIYALALVLVAALLAWFLKPTPPPMPQPAVAAPSQATPAAPKNEAAAATPSG
jgi:hypothetical protein